MLSINPRLRGAVASITTLGAVLSLLALPAGAAASTYPAGGGTFSDDAQGWQVPEASCNVTLLSTCEAKGEHDASSGNPPGSLTAKTTFVLAVAGLFESTVVLESPDFTVAGGGTGTLHVDRQFAPGALLTLSPEAAYTVSLVDRGTGTPTEVLNETLDEGDTSFTGKDGVATVVAGRTYAISIEVETKSLAALVLLDGSTDVRFDNVALSVQESAVGQGGNGGGAAGGGSLSSSELFDSVRRSSQETALIRGNRVFVRVACPRRVRRACRISAQGMIGKKLRVTRRSTVRVASGRAKLIGLRVKPRFRDKVASRKRLLVVQKVRAGDASTTFARTRVLVQRG